MTILKIISALLLLYAFLYAIRLLISMLNFEQNQLTLYLCRITDPVIVFFRKIIPIRLGVVDLSSIIPLLLIFLILKVLSDFTDTQVNLNLYYVIALFIFIIRYLLSFILFALGLFSLILIFVNYRSPLFYHSFIVAIRSVVTPVVIVLKKIFPGKKQTSDTPYYIGIIFLSLIGSIFFSYFLEMLYIYFIKLSMGRIHSAS